jgi:YfiH family protein
MQVHEVGAVRYYQFETLDPDRVVQAVFARQGGVSPAPYASLNMSVSTGDTRENVRANRERAFRALGRAPNTLADVWQVHSATVVVADEPNGERSHLAQADALITDNPAVTLFQRFADCVPIVLYDPVRPAVGLIHAGWRGTLAKAPAVAARAMAERFGSRPADLQAAIGPSIGPCHYDVGPEVAGATRQAFGPAADALLSGENGTTRLDLWAANLQALREVGVDQVEVAGVCTACHSGDFFSHRAERGRTGRFGALVALR